MQIEVKELEPYKLLVMYASDSDEVSDKTDEVLQVFKNAPVSGFRKGKAPLSVIKNKYKDQINNSLKNALLEEAYHNIVFEKKLDVFGQPDVMESNLINNNFSCAFKLTVKPDFELKPYDQYEVVKPPSTLSVSDLSEKILQDLRVKYGEVSQYDENSFVQNGDSIIVNYTGSIDGELNENLCATGEMLTIGASRLEDFDSHLLGMSVSEERSFDLLIPKEAIPSLASKTATFTVTLVTGSRPAPAPLDDSLAIKLGKTTLVELREMVAASASNQVAESEKRALNQALSTLIINDYDFSVPDWMIVGEAQQNAARSGIQWDKTYEEDKRRFLDNAAMGAKLSLVLSKIREDDPDANMTDQEIYESVKNIMLQFAPANVNEGNVLEEMKKLQSNGQLAVIGARLLEDHTMKFILSKSKIVE